MTPPAQRHVLLVFTTPEEGRDEEYNDWYTNHHLDDVLELDGVVAAQRFRLATTDPPQEGHHPYLAIYEVEGDLDTMRAALARALQSWHITDAIQSDLTDSSYYTALTERVSAPGTS